MDLSYTVASLTKSSERSSQSRIEAPKCSSRRVLALRLISPFLQRVTYCIEMLSLNLERSVFDSTPASAQLFQVFQQRLQIHFFEREPRNNHDTLTASTLCLALQLDVAVSQDGIILKILADTIRTWLLTVGTDPTVFAGVDQNII